MRGPGTKTGDLGPSHRAARQAPQRLAPPASRQPQDRPPAPGAPPAPSGSRRAPGTAAVGLRTAPSPAGSKRPGRVQEGGRRSAVSSARRPVGARSAASAPPPRPRTLTPTYPVPHHPRGLRRSGLSAEAGLPPVPGLKWLRNKENPGSGERRSDWPGGGARRGNLPRRSPWQRRRGWENCGLGLPACVGRRAAAVSLSGVRGRGLVPATASNPLAPAAAPTIQPGAQSQPPLPGP